MPSLTPASRLHDALRTLRWSQRTLADFFRVNERTVRRWAAARYPIPAASLTWLERVAAFVRDNPAP